MCKQKGSVSLTNKKKKKKPTHRLRNLFRMFQKIPLNIGTFIFGAIFIYMVISVALYLTADHIESYQVTAGPLAQNQTYTALALREEKVVTAAASGYITYYARENSKVAKSGVVYTLGESQTEAAVDELSENDYSRIRSSIAGFASSFDNSNFYQTYNYKYELEGTILQYSGLKSTEDGQIPQNVGGQAVYTAAQDGVILYSTDGYESVTEDQLTKELFNKKDYSIKSLQSSRKVDAGDDIYKLITSEEWSLIIPLTDEQTVQLAGRKNIRVKFLKDDTTQMGKFSILTNDSGEFFCKITFNSGMIRYSNDRFLEVELVTNTKSGLKIPLSSIVTKDFYVIPKEYVTHNEEDGSAGFNKKIVKKEKESSEFVQATIYQEDENYYYVDSSTFQKGDVIIKPDSQSTFTVEETKALEGVYSINKGYAVFRQIAVIDQNDEYCIVETGTKYGIAQFDHIVRNGNTVKEDDILYK
ncbi:MAG: HlyD family efflux transporter periplasmic adaptor subunit [Bacillota bacterium]|nr:HlyD family efflux transporter periplasmic adaptor subunit [Bacillota bacterium]